MEEKKTCSCGCGHDHHHHEDTRSCGRGHDHHHHEDTCACGCGHDHHHEDSCGCGCGHDHNHEDSAAAQKELRVLVGGALLLGAGLVLGEFMGKLVLIAAFLLVASDIVVGAVKNIRRGNVFGENFLMTVAGVGAVCIGEIPEGVLVFLLYRLGEFLQTKAVSSSRKSISALLDTRPDRANLVTEDGIIEMDARRVQPGQIILVRPGEKIPLDSVIVSGTSALDTAALTGESLPREVHPGQSVMAGCINVSGALELRVEKGFGDSTASKILEMVEHASAKKAASEKFITRFARIYTPIVVAAAVLVAALPPVLGWMTFSDAVYSALCFLAISCPCSLVISVPLSFFAGIGRASRAGVLVKGGNHLETMAKAEIVAFDKTGTLTRGQFCVHEVRCAHGVSREQLLMLAALAESRSTHPIAQSLVAAWEGNVDDHRISDCRETGGNGVTALVDDHLVAAGKGDFLRELGIDVPREESIGASTAVYVAADSVWLGTVLLRDEPKADAARAIAELKKLGIRKTAMLSGDSAAAAEEIGRELGLDYVAGELLPQDKLSRVETLRGELSAKGKLLYAGDGINDTPVLAGADIGIAMGGLGADAAIETADVVIMGDEPGKVAEGISIARFTTSVAVQNIVISIVLKVLVMVLSVLGVVELWAAVLADVGVCMLCILNTLRINLK